MGDGAVFSVGEEHPPISGHADTSGLRGEVGGETDVVRSVFVGAAAPFADDDRDAQFSLQISVDVREQAVDIVLLGVELFRRPTLRRLHN